MGLLLRLVDRLLCGIITFILRGVNIAMDVVLWLDGLRRRIPRGLRRWTGSLRRLVNRLFCVPPPAPVLPRRGRRPWNRTPDHLEEQLVRLHVEHGWLGAAGLGRLARRVFAFNACRETVRRILLRRKDLVVALEQQRRRRPRRIEIHGARLLWGVDLTLVWLLGFIPVWLLGVVDYQGSRIVCLQRLSFPSTKAVVGALECAFLREGRPVRLLTDNAPIFTSEAFVAFLAGHDVKHARIRPAHAWTNGRIERLFRTFKETVFRYAWVFTSLRQLDRWCADFVRFYNRDRPHSSYGGFTPDEVAAGSRCRSPAHGRVTYFDGRMHWYAFG